MYKKIGLALAFSPRCQAMLAEAFRLKRLFGAELYCIHIGPKGKAEEEFMEDVLEKASIKNENIHLIWEEGKPINKILQICKSEGIELLVAGALQKENLFNFYIGSVARKIIRKAACSVLMLTHPSLEPKPFQKIVINGSDGVRDLKTIQRGIRIAHLEKIHQTYIFKDIHGYGLSLMMSTEESEAEFAERRRELVHQEIDEMNELIHTIDTFDVHINIKVAGGKEGHELKKFVQKIDADLLVIKAPGRQLKFFDRLFPHYLEIIMTDLPSNLLIDRN